MPLRDSTGAIEETVIDIVNQVDIGRRHNGKDNDYSVDSYTNSVVTCHICEKVPLKGKCNSTRNGSDGYSSDMSNNNLQKLFTKKPIVSGVKYLTTTTIKLKKRITNGVFLEIMVILHGGFTVKLATSSGKTSMARRSWFTLVIPKIMR